MDNKHIKAKLDTYIKEYSKLLEENANLKLTLEKELLEREKMINEYKVGIYLRLSKEDERLGESASITNQRDIIKKYINENNLKSILLSFIILL